MGLPRSTYYDAPVATADEAEIVARIEAICEEGAVNLTKAGRS